MLKFFAVSGAFVGGLIAGWSAAMLGYIIATNALGVIDRDGGMAMGVAFTLGPLLGLITGIVLAILVARRMGRKAASGAAQ